jgi:hypothetical protein
MLCLVIYCALEVLACSIQRFKDGRRFLNKINVLLWKASSGSTQITANLNRRTLEILPCILFLTFDVSVTVIYHWLTLSAQPIFYQLTWLSFYSVRWSLIPLEHLGIAIATDLKKLFFALNEEILNLESSQLFFVKTNTKRMTKSGMLGTIKSVAVRFSNLSIALKELNAFYGLFWLLNVAHLSTIITFLFSRWLSKESALMAAFLLVFGVVTSLRLSMLCFRLGDASAEVSSHIFTEYLIIIFKLPKKAKRVSESIGFAMEKTCDTEELKQVGCHFLVYMC